MVVKTISLWQPWATLIALGQKQIETRSWDTSYRGPLLIHAAKRWTADQVSICREEPFRSVLADAGLRGTLTGVGFPFGEIVALVDLLNVVPAELVVGISTRERAFGDFRVGRFAWLLNGVQLPRCRMTMRGQQKMWDVRICPGDFAA